MKRAVLPVIQLRDMVKNSSDLIEEKCGLWDA